MKYIFECDGISDLVDLRVKLDYLIGDGDSDVKGDIDELKLSSRVYHCLKANDINKISELTSKRKRELLNYANFGKRSMKELDKVLSERGIYLAG